MTHRPKTCGNVTGSWQSMNDMALSYTPNSVNATSPTATPQPTAPLANISRSVYTCNQFIYKLNWHIKRNRKLTNVWEHHGRHTDRQTDRPENDRYLSFVNGSRQRMTTKCHKSQNDAFPSTFCWLTQGYLFYRNACRAACVSRNVWTKAVKLGLPSETFVFLGAIPLQALTIQILFLHLRVLYAYVPKYQHKYQINMLFACVLVEGFNMTTRIGGNDIDVFGHISIDLHVFEKTRNSN